MIDLCRWFVTSANCMPEFLRLPRDASHLGYPSHSFCAGRSDLISKGDGGRALQAIDPVEEAVSRAQEALPAEEEGLRRDEERLPPEPSQARAGRPPIEIRAKVQRPRRGNGS